MTLEKLRALVDDLDLHIGANVDDVMAAVVDYAAEQVAAEQKEIMLELWAMKNTHSLWPFDVAIDKAIEAIRARKEAP